MSSDQNFWIPRNLDAPKLIFIWDADNAALAIIIMILTALLNMFVFGFILAIWCCKGYTSLKNEGGRGLMVKLIYWYTPLLAKEKLPAYRREFIGG